MTNVLQGSDFKPRNYYFALSFPIDLGTDCVFIRHRTVITWNNNPVFWCMYDVPHHEKLQTKQFYVQTFKIHTHHFIKITMLRYENMCGW